MNKNPLNIIAITVGVCNTLENMGYSKQQVNNFITDAEIVIDSGWECSETGFTDVYINLEKEQIALVNDHQDWVYDKENSPWIKVEPAKPQCQKED